MSTGNIGQFEPLGDDVENPSPNRGWYMQSLVSNAHPKMIYRLHIATDNKRFSVAHKPSTNMMGLIQMLDVTIPCHLVRIPIIFSSSAMM